MLTTLATRHPAAIHTCPTAPGLISPFLTIQEGLVPLETHLPLSRTHQSCQAAPSPLFTKASQPPAHGMRLFTNRPAGAPATCSGSCRPSCHSASQLPFQLEQQAEGTVLTSPEPLVYKSRQILPVIPPRGLGGVWPRRTPHPRTRRHKSQRFGTNLRSERAGGATGDAHKTGP